MEELLMELKPKVLSENDLLKIKKRKKLFRNIWIGIGLILLICIVISASGILVGTALENVVGYAFATTAIFALIMFFPTMINLNNFMTGNTIDRNDCYIKVYNDRLECYQILGSLKEENEKAILYYDEMVEWNIKHREVTNTSAKSHQVNCIQITMDSNAIKSQYDNMQMQKFYVEMAGYNRDEFMKAMKVAFEKANEYKKIPYHTYNDYYTL